MSVASLSIVREILISKAFLVLTKRVQVAAPAKMSLRGLLALSCVACVAFGQDKEGAFAVPRRHPGLKDIKIAEKRDPDVDSKGRATHIEIRNTAHLESYIDELPVTLCIHIFHIRVGKIRRQYLFLIYCSRADISLFCFTTHRKMKRR